MSRFAISEPAPLGAGSISWLLAQTFWVGGLWLLHFVVLPGLEKMGLAPMLVDEAGAAQMERLLTVSDTELASSMISLMTSAMMVACS